MPLPAAYQQGAYAGAAARYDLDRVTELPFVEQGLLAPIHAELAGLQLTTDPGAAVAAAQLGRRGFAVLVAYCCKGLYRPDGSRLPGTDLDNVDGWAGHSRQVLRWLAQRGWKDPEAQAEAPFQIAPPI